VCYTGTASAVFATTSCLSAGIRDKDDHVNAMVGGACAGLIFGFRSEHIYCQAIMLLRCVEGVLGTSVHYLMS